MRLSFHSLNAAPVGTALSLLALLMLVFGANTAAIAHQQKAAMTTVLFNPRTDNLEVSHRFLLHDAEHAVKALFSKKADILNSKETQQQFYRYVMERFAVLQENGKALTLQPVGYEIEGKFFWVYQETSTPDDVQQLIFRHDALRDLWPRQINTVNIEGAGDIKTRIFSGNIELLRVQF